MDPVKKQKYKSSIKFTVGLFAAAVVLGLLVMCAIISFRLVTGGFTSNTLVDIGVFFRSILTLVISSASANFLYINAYEIATTLSTYRFYKTLIGQGSFSLLSESYFGVVNTFNVPIKAQHKDGNGQMIYGQWNGIGNWTVNGKKTTRGYKQ